MNSIYECCIKGQKVVAKDRFWYFFAYCALNVHAWKSDSAKPTCK